MFNLFRLCRKDEISFDVVAVCGNKVECCFGIVADVDGALGSRIEINVVVGSAVPVFGRGRHQDDVHHSTFRRRSCRQAARRR